MTGLTSYLAGQAAEDAVVRHCERQGLTVIDQRWRGPGGEIDVIARQGEGLVFIEVKHARSHDDAAESLSERQMRRIMTSALDYCESLPTGALTEMRFDVALVDRAGEVRVLQNAFCA